VRELSLKQARAMCRRRRKKWEKLARIASRWTKKEKAAFEELMEALTLRNRLIDRRHKR